MQATPLHLQPSMLQLLSYPYQTPLGGQGHFWFSGSLGLFGEGCIGMNWWTRRMIEFVYHLWPNLESCNKRKNFNVFKIK